MSLSPNILPCTSCNTLKLQDITSDEKEKVEKHGESVQITPAGPGAGEKTGNLAGQKMKKRQKAIGYIGPNAGFRSSHASGPWNYWQFARPNCKAKSP